MIHATKNKLAGAPAFCMDTNIMFGQLDPAGHKHCYDGPDIIYIPLLFGFNLDLS